MTPIRIAIGVILVVVTIVRLLVERGRRFERFAAIKANRDVKTFRYRAGMDTYDPELRKRREGERSIAEQHRRDARQVETKEKTAKRIHLAS